MPAKKFKPPPIVKVTPEDIPPEWMAKIDGLPKKLKRTWVFNVIGCRLSQMGCHIAEPARMDEALTLGWSLIQAGANVYRGAYADRDEANKIRRAEREAYWKDLRDKREAQRRERMEKDIKRTNKRSRADIIDWVMKNLHERNITQDLAPSPEAFSLWKQSHANPEWFVEKVYAPWAKPTTKDVEEDGKRSKTSTKTIEELDRMLSEHILESNVQETDRPAAASA